MVEIASFEKNSGRIKLGIMGGTFDPIHYGHLVAAEEARTQFNLQEVVFVPSGNPPHKKNYTITPAEHRYRMTALATMSNPFFKVSRMEIDRPGYSYAIDTVLSFKKQYKEEIELYFITGADAILEILTWKNVQSLMQECCFIAATRPGFDLQELHKKLLNLNENFAKYIQIIEVPALAISSTDLRERIAQGRTIKYLMPEVVEEYIYKNNLYLLNISSNIK